MGTCSETLAHTVSWPLGLFSWTHCCWLLPQVSSPWWVSVGPGQGDIIAERQVFQSVGIGFLIFSTNN